MADKYEKYVYEIEENKEKLKENVSRLEDLLQKLDELIPKKYDYKTRFVLQDRVDVMSRLYDTILKYRSEIASQIKTQVNIQKLEEQPDDNETGKNAVVSLTIEQLKQLAGDLNGGTDE